jgi:hypothetical protein
MDDKAAQIAQRVAMPRPRGSTPQDVEAYRQLAAAVSEWNAYCAWRWRH